MLSRSSGYSAWVGVITPVFKVNNYGLKFAFSVSHIPPPPSHIGEIAGQTVECAGVEVLYKVCGADKLSLGSALLFSW